MLPDQFGGICANFLAHFTHTGIKRAFPSVNAALRHLPGFGAAINTAPGKHFALII